jgi:predicted aspartyl protease
LGIALKNKDFALAEKVLAPDFSISAATLPGARSLLDMILQNRKIESVELKTTDMQEGADTTLVKVDFILQDGRNQESIVALDKENRILFIDYFDRLFGQSRYYKSSLVETIPFKREMESVILSLKLNDCGRPLSFLLDTGADGMAIRKSLADSLGLNISRTQNANIVGGQAQVNISSGNIVHLSDSLTLKNQNIAIFDKVRGGLDGIIGMNLVKQYITKIDFDKEQIEFYSFGDYQYADGGKTIKVSIPYNLILVPSELNIVGKKSIAANFIMDTGANYHLIAFSKFVRKNRLLLTGFKPESQGSTVSLGHATPVFHGRAYELKVGDIVQNDIPVTLQAGASDSSDSKRNIPDGSIGIQFFSNYNLTIDLLRKEIHMSPRKQVNTMNYK